MTAQDNITGITMRIRKTMIKMSCSLSVTEQESLQMCKNKIQLVQYLVLLGRINDRSVTGNSKVGFMKGVSTYAKYNAMGINQTKA